MFRSTGSYEPDPSLAASAAVFAVFRSTGSYEPDLYEPDIRKEGFRFRSTGSYEPDLFLPDRPIRLDSFDPQALTSLTGKTLRMTVKQWSFDPQALTSLTKTIAGIGNQKQGFRSTGSYEPDPK